MNIKWMVDWEKKSLELLDDHDPTDSDFINSICKKIKVTDHFSDSDDMIPNSELFIL